MWKIDFKGKKPQLRNPILVEGLPGIGNVGKVAIDFIIDELKATKMAEFSSFTLPHSVYVNEQNLVELPSIELYYKKFKNKRNDLLLLAGDVQPIDEVACYEFSDKVLEVAKEFNCKEVITLGGIAMKIIPKKPKVFCTGNNKKTIQKYKKGMDNININLYGVVGPIIGVSGVLLGLAGRKKIPAVSLLAETYGHPLYLGVKGAKEILRILNKKLSLKVNINAMDTEIKDLEQELGSRAKEVTAAQQKALAKLRGKFGKDVSYIG